MMHNAQNNSVPVSRLSAETSAVDVLVRQIKEFIGASGLAVGDLLPSERELGERFNAARNTVREAIRILKAYGVVEVRPKVGTVLVNRHMDAALNLFSFQLSISRETFLDIQGFRRLIEVGVTDALFENTKPPDLEALRRINASILQAGTSAEAANLDFEFHARLLSIAKNETVLSVYNTMKSLICRLMETGKKTEGLEKTYTHHELILDALARKDRLGFQYHMSVHLDQGLKYIESSVAEDASQTQAERCTNDGS